VLKIIALVLTLLLLIGVIALGAERPIGGTSLGVSPVGLDFGKVEVGTTTRPREITLTSTGSKSVELGEIIVRGSHPADFKADGKCSGRTLRTDQTCAVKVTFSPSEEGSHSARLAIHSADGGTETVSLSGTGAGGTAHTSLSPSEMNVSAAVGETTTRRFTLENTGSASFKIYGVALNDQYGFFSSTNDTCTDISLEPGASCSIEVNFLPTSNNDSEGELVIKHDAPGGPSRARLEGATTLPPTGETTLSPSSTASPSSSSTASPVP